MATYDTVVSITGRDGFSPAAASASAASDRLAASFRRLQANLAAIGSGGTGLTKINSQISALGAGLSRVGSLADAARSKLQGIGTGLSIGTAAGIAALRGLGDEIARLNEAQTNFKLGMNFDGSPESQKRVDSATDKALAISKKYAGYTPSEAVSLLDEANRAGFDEDKAALVAAETEALALQSKGKLSRGQAFNTVTTLMRQSYNAAEFQSAEDFKKLYSETTRAIIATANSGTIDVEQFASGLKNANPAMRAALGKGAAIEARTAAMREAMALTATIVENGAQPGEAGRALRTGTLRFADLTPKAAQGLKVHGVDVSAAMAAKTGAMEPAAIAEYMRSVVPNVTEKDIAKAWSGTAGSNTTRAIQASKAIAKQFGLDPQNAKTVQKEMMSYVQLLNDKIDVPKLFEMLENNNISTATASAIFGKDRFAQLQGIRAEQVAKYRKSIDEELAKPFSSSNIENSMTAVEGSFGIFKKLGESGKELVGSAIWSAIARDMMGLAKGFRDFGASAFVAARTFPEMAQTLGRVGLAVLVAGPAMLALSLAMKAVAFAAAPAIAAVRLLGGAVVGTFALMRGLALLPLAALVAGAALLGKGLSAAVAPLKQIGEAAAPALGLVKGLWTAMSEGKGDEARAAAAALGVELGVLAGKLRDIAGQSFKGFSDSLGGGEKFGLMAAGVTLLAVRSTVARAAIAGLGAALLSLGRIGAGLAALRALPAAIGALGVGAAATAAALAPLAVGVAVLAAAGAVVWSQWDKVGPIFGEAGKAAVAAGSDIASAAGKAMGGDMSGAWSSLKSAASNTATAVALSFKGLGKAINEQLKESFGVDLEPAMTTLGEAIDKVTCAAGKSFDGSGFSRAASLMLEPFRTMGADAVASMRYLGLMWDGLTKLGTGVNGSVISAGLEALGTGIGNLFSGLGKAGEGGIGMLVSAFQSASGFTSGLLAFSTALSQGKGLTAALADGSAAFFGRVQKGADTAREAIEAFKKSGDFLGFQNPIKVAETVGKAGNEVVGAMGDGLKPADGEYNYQKIGRYFSNLFSSAPAVPQMSALPGVSNMQPLPVRIDGFDLAQRGTVKSFAEQGINTNGAMGGPLKFEPVGGVLRVENSSPVTAELTGSATINIGITAKGGEVTSTSTSATGPFKPNLNTGRDITAASAAY